MLKIALCGVHGSGKDTLVQYIQGLLDAEGLSDSIAVLPSASRYVASLSGEPTDGSSDWVALWGAVQRRLWGFEAEASNQIVLSPRCGLDDVAYQFARVQRMHAEFQARLQRPSGLVIPGAEGEPDQQLMDEETARMQVFGERASIFLNVLLEQTAYEIADWWDFVYYKPRRRDIELEDDGVRPTDVDLTNQIEDGYIRTIEDSPLTEVLTQNVRRLPDDLTDARTALSDDLPLWVEKFANSIAPEPAEV